MRKVFILLFIILSTQLIAQNLTVTITASNVTCNGTCDGLITVNASGGSGNYNYELFNASNVSVATATSNTFSGLCAGEFYVRVIDSNNTQTDSNTVTIVEPAALNMTVEVIDSGTVSSGVIIMNVTGGVPPYVYNLTGTQYISTNVFSDLAPGDYTVSAQDQNGCLVQKSNVTIAQTTNDTSVENTGDELSAKIDADSYQWINAANQTSISGANQKTYKVTEVGKYRVEMEKNGQRISSETFEVTTLGVDNVSLKSLKVYPNPTSKLIKVPTELIGEEFTIVSVLGKQVLSGKITQEQINIEDLSKGIFFLKVKKHKAFKFVKK
ncbi:hypothetical protein WH52_03425 [Tenacibaculum holothuriorum]|uniref:Secretion system C-terminal sorting domain-containing protein n=1 Tax=Tenacibaculum holothuriorum TaxID=1635173 RepID=A0A1Y2PGD4_9FLAO|nr:SprB repeat-containing protein [Tenacibaculum holothuriorum]OSY88738.1 hypothetical protein WH52_03425 [Tenacibaculum holothuriorum]